MSTRIFILPIGAQAQEYVGFLCSRVDEQNQNSTIKSGFSHELHQYPRGPMVEAFRVRRSIKKAYAASIDPTEAQSVIGEANAFRVEADPDDSSVTLIKLSNLPPPLNARPIAFWEAAFGEACLHGPRMLAALLLVVPDAQFPSDARADRQRLLNSLRI